MGRVMSAEQNKAVLRRYFEELWNKGNLAVIDECIAPGMSLNEGKNTSLEKWRQALSAWLTAFPDFEYHVDLLIADGGEEGCVEEMIGGWGGVDGGSEVSVKIAMNDEIIQRGLFERVGMLFVADEEGFGGAVEDQGFKPFLQEWM